MIIVLFFSAAHACSKTDPLTGLTKQEFETPYTLPHTIGGWIPVSMRMRMDKTKTFTDF